MINKIIAGAGIVGLLVGFIILDELISSRPFAAPKLDKLTSFQAKQIDIYVEMNKQLLTLASFVFAGFGLYFSLAFRRGTISSLKHRGHTLTASISLAAMSICMGYLSYDKMVWMLSKEIVALDMPLLYWLRLLQFWSFVVSISLFGYFWLTLTHEKSSE